MSEKVVLERDDLRRTLRRIAHEIAEKNPEPEGLAIVGIHTRGALLARRLHALLGELTGAELPIGDIDISFYRDDVGAKSPGRAAGRPRLPHRLRPRPAAPSSSSTTSSSPAAPCAPRSTPSSTTAARSGSSSPCSATAATASCRSAPTTSARTCRPRASERVNVRLEEIDGVDEVTISEPRAEVSGMKHLLAIEQLSPRGDRGDPRPRRELRRGRPPRHQEGADPARPHRRQPLLRVEHPHQLLLRAGREAALRRPRLGQGGRLLGRQGRVAEGHGRDPLRLRPGGDRDPPPATPAPPQLVAGWTDAAVVNAGDGKHEHPSQALLDVYTLRRRLGSLEGKRIWIVGDVLHSRVARSNLIAFQRDGRRGDRLRPADPDPARDRGARLRGRPLARPARARPTSSTRCGCSTSG